MAHCDINLREYWSILKKRKSIVIITAILLGLFSTIFAVLQAPAPLYTSVSRIKIEKETTLEGLFSRDFLWTGGDDIETQMSTINSPSVLLEAAKKTGIIPPGSTGEEPEIIDLIDLLKSQVRVKRENNTNILNIMVTDTDPAFAQNMADKLANAYKDFHAEQQGKRITGAMKYIEEQLEATRDKLKKSEEKLTGFNQANQIISIELQNKNLLSRQNEIEEEIRKRNKDKRELASLSDRVKTFLQNPSRSTASLYSTNTDPRYQEINNRLSELLSKREVLLENFTPQNPKVTAIENKVKENARKMLGLLDQQIDTIEKRVADLKEELETVKQNAAVLMEKEMEHDRLKREVETIKDMATLLERKNQEAFIKTEKPEQVVIVSKAPLPAKPINSSRPFVTGFTGLVIGIALGLVFAFIIEVFSNSLGAIEDIEKTLNSTVLGVIPYTDPKDIKTVLKDLSPGERDKPSLKRITSLVTHFSPKTTTAESFRALRTTVQSIKGDGKVKTIGVTSTTAQEGKTLLSVNLALSLAQTGFKTLLVGADLRTPKLGEIFGIEEHTGLTDIILGNFPWNDTVKTITDIIMGRMSTDEVMITPGMDNLNIITSGGIPPNPAELMDSKLLGAFIEDAKTKYDIILFDSTPVLSTAEASVLGKQVDGVLIVYRPGFVSRGLLKRTFTQLEQIGCHILGVILNGMKTDAGPEFSGKEKRKGLLRTWLFFIAGLLFLGSGILWYTGILTPSTPHPSPEKLPTPQTSTTEALPAPVTKKVHDYRAIEKPDEPEPEKAFTYREKRFPFSIYLGSFLTKEKANRAIDHYKQKGLSPYRVKVDLNEKGIWYRIYTGYYEKRDQAKSIIKEKGLQEANVKNTAYANLIGTFETLEALEAGTESIKGLGFSPYVVKDEEHNRFILFVGAFITRSGAEKQNGELQSRGIPSRLVER